MDRVKVFSIVRAAILFVAVVLCIAGTSAQQMSISSANIFLYGYTNDNGGWNSISAIGCPTMESQINAALAFAIISCVVIGLLLIAVSVSICGIFAKISVFFNIATLCVSGFGIVSTIIAWALVAATYTNKSCFGQSLGNVGWRLNAGFYLLIFTTILMIADSVVAILLGRLSAIVQPQLLGENPGDVPFVPLQAGHHPQQFPPQYQPQYPPQHGNLHLQQGFLQLQQGYLQLQQGYLQLQQGFQQMQREQGLPHQQQNGPQQGQPPYAPPQIIANVQPQVNGDAPPQPGASASDPTS